MSCVKGIQVSIEVLFIGNRLHATPIYPFLNDCWLMRSCVASPCRKLSKHKAYRITEVIRRASVYNSGAAALISEEREAAPRMSAVESAKVGQGHRNQT